jgi:hypothetical protein
MVVFNQVYIVYLYGQVYCIEPFCMARKDNSTEIEGLERFREALQACIEQSVAARFSLNESFRQYIFS